MTARKAAKESETRVARIPEAAPVSRALRFVLGVTVSAWILPRVLAARPVDQVQVLGMVVAITAFYVLVHWLVRRYLAWLHPWIGACLVVAPVLFLLVLGPNASAAALLYVGLSLVLISLRGEPGCECLAVPAMLWRRPTHLACLLFSPLDWVENEILGRGQEGP